MKHLKNGLPHFDLYHATYGGTLATGREAAPTTDLYMQHRNVADEADSTGEDDGDEPKMDTGPRSGDKRPSSSQGGTGRRRGRAECRSTSLRCRLWHQFWCRGLTQMLVLRTSDSSDRGAGIWRRWCASSATYRI